MNRCVHLLIQTGHRLAGVGVEPGQRQVDRLATIAPDGVRLGDVDQTAGADDLVDRTFVVGLANRVGPRNQVVDERIVAGLVSIEDRLDDLPLDLLGRIVLLQRGGEAVDERFVEHVGAHKLAALAALPLGVGGGNDREAGCRVDPLVHQFQVHAATLQHRLETHDLVAAEVHLVEQQHRTSPHRLDHGTVAEHALAVDEAHTTQQVVLVGFDGDVDANALTIELVTHLHGGGGLAATAESGDEQRVEPAALDHAVNVVVVAEREVALDAIGHIVDVVGGADGSHGAACHRSINRQTVGAATHAETLVVAQPVRKLKGAVAAIDQIGDLLSRHRVAVGNTQGVDDCGTIVHVLLHRKGKIKLDSRNLASRCPGHARLYAAGEKIQETASRFFSDGSTIICTVVSVEPSSAASTGCVSLLPAIMVFHASRSSHGRRNAARPTLNGLGLGLVSHDGYRSTIPRPPTSPSVQSRWNASSSCRVTTGLRP